MLTDYQIADHLVKLYDPVDEPLDTAGFDFFESGETCGGVCWAGKQVDGVYWIFLRGSKTLGDWLRDLMAVANPFNHKGLGPVHSGFALGISDVWKEIQSHSSGPYAIAGHSLGAGESCILAGRMILDGAVPLARIAFGEPRPGFRQLADLLSVIPEQRSYRNGHGFHHDFVTDVPVTLAIEEYIHPVDLTHVNVAPAGGLAAALSPFGFHHMPLYRQALKGAAGEWEHVTPSAPASAG